jgi:uncharacterized protein (DUF1330 family)
MERPMTALMISQVQIKNPAQFQDYLKKSKVLASTYGAELVFRGRLDHVINGSTSAHQLVVAARFPSLDKLRDWHESEAYRELVALRDSGSDQLMLGYEELD